MPETPRELMDLSISSDFTDEETLGEFVKHILTTPSRWRHGSPSDQSARLKKAEEREDRERQEAALRQQQLVR